MVSQAEGFDPAARRALTYAQLEAQQLNHNYIGTEHLLLGLLRDETGLACRLLRQLGVELVEARRAVELVVGPGPIPVTGQIGLTPRSKQVLDLATAAARAQQQPLAGQEHLVLALLNARDATPPGKGIAAHLLENFGVTAEQVEAELPQARATFAEEEAGREHLRQLAAAGRWEEVQAEAAQLHDRQRQGRRYSLVLPEGLFEEVERLAERQHTSVVELLRRFTRLGLLAMQLQERPNTALILREGDAERQLLLL